MLCSLAASAQLQFTGVASGDASTATAIVWARAQDPSVPNGVPISVQVSMDSSFGAFDQSNPATPGPGTDYTLKFALSSLVPGARYYYRFHGPNGELSDIGTFKTAPAPDAEVGLRFAFSGDCDGLIRPYALASQIPNKQLDFFMFDGDTEYETSASIGSPAVTSTGNIPAPSSTGATSNQLFVDFSRKYREQFFPVNSGGQSCLKGFFTGQGNYTIYDNHELGNKQYINGGAPAGTAVGDMPTGAGVDARQSVNDTNFSTGDYMNRSVGFQTLQQVYLNYQPVAERGLVNNPSDPRTHGTRQLYFAHQWGRHAVFINVDDRTYRDIRLKTAGNADDTGARADNSNRTILGVTQLTWLKNTLLEAEQAGTTWKFINISDPIDQIGPIGGDLSLVSPPTTSEYGTLGSISSISPTNDATASTTIRVLSSVGLVVGQGVSGTGVPANTTISAINTDGTRLTLNNPATVTKGETLALTPAPSTYAPVSNDGGKSWMGGYRAERNELLKFIADNNIRNVVFMATDDHQNRVNELLYAPSGRTGPGSPGYLGQAQEYVKVPYCFSIVCGPLGATGPDQITTHTFALAKKLADSISNAEVNANVEPLGLAGYPGLHNITRLGDPNADSAREAVDFYSPDTFNYNLLDVSPDGQTLSVTSYGINSTIPNGFVEYDSANNPEQVLFSFQIDAPPRITSCPNSVTLSNDPGLCSATHDFLAVASGIPAPTITYLLNNLPIIPPYVFPKGRSEVTCVASNFVGANTCTFTVTVNDTEPPAVSVARTIVEGDAVTTLLAQDNCDGSNLRIFVKDSAQGSCGGTFSASPYSPGTKVSLKRHPNKTSVAKGSDGTAAKIKTVGNPVLVVTDSSGNTTCTIVPIPKD